MKRHPITKEDEVRSLIKTSFDTRGVAEYWAGRMADTYKRTFYVYQMRGKWKVSYRRPAYTISAHLG